MSLTEQPDWAFVGIVAVILGLEKLVSVIHTLHYVQETLPGEKIVGMHPAAP